MTLATCCSAGCWPQAAVAVEVDSKEWHLLPGDWQRTLRRHRRMTAAGIYVVHLTPAELRAEPRQVVEDIAAALDRGRPAHSITTRAAAGTADDQCRGGSSR